MFSVVGQSLKSPQEISRLLKSLGWDTPPGFDGTAFAVANIEELIEKLRIVLESTQEEREDEVLMITRIAELTAATIRFVEQVVQMANNLNSTLSSLGDYVAKTKIDQEFFIRLFDFLIVSYVYRNSPPAFAVIQFLGIFEQKIFPADPTVYQVAHVRSVIHYNRVGTLFSSPDNLITESYGWGTSDYSADNLLRNFVFLLNTIGAEVVFNFMSRKVEEALLNRSIPEADTDPASRSVITLLSEVGEDFVSEVKLVAYEVRPSNVGGTDGGIGFFPVIKGTADIEFSLSDNLTLALEGEIDFTKALNLVLRPNQSPHLETGMYAGPGDVPLTAKILAGLLYRGDSEEPINIFSFPGGTKLDLQKIALKLGAEKQRTGSFEPLGELEIDNLRLIVGLSGADSFLQEGVGQNELTASFNLTVGWAKNGIYFKGGASLELLIPTHIELGPIELSHVIVAIKVQNEVVILELGTTVALALGPLNAVVENIGAKAELSFNESTGSFGPFDLSLAFKPPNGVGLSIDAGAVTGGGYLFFDFDKEEYAGILQLDISGFVTINAVGLITTKMPDGSKGFSLLVIMSVEFSPGIQLGFGFTFLGIGGLLGLNRTVELEVLAQGIRTGILNNIMFPQGDIIANAPRIISDLRSIFPPEEGKFLVGPMVKLGWGTPTLISVSIGVIIEIPGNFAIVGVLRVALPTADAPLIIIQVAFIGAVEFDKQRLWFFASMFESRVIFITLEGEMGLLVAWGDDANFVVSVGGFHPRFNPPPLPFPSPRRIAMDLSNNPAYSVRIEGYFAVTSNTVQFGARAELRIGLDDFGIQGHIAFDALFQFSPFYFIIEISASVSLRVFGFDCFTIRLEFSLEGPTPYRARGSGYISILFWEFSADFDVTWGESQDTSLPPIEAMPLLVAEFEKIENWKAELPPGNNLLVSLRKLNEATDLLVLHPVGVLRISQRAIPLDLTLDKIGSQKTTGANKFSVNVNTVNLGLKGKVDEQFAMAQFQNMSDAEKLSRPSYQPNPGGVDVSVSGNQLKTSGTVKRIVRYELITIDTNYKRFPQMFFEFVGSLFYHFFRGSAVTKSVMSQSFKQQRKPFPEAVELMPDHHVVALIANNMAVSDQAVFASEALAREYMSTQIAANPNLSEQLHVIPQFEAITAS